jgi:hypothetical protein
VAYDQEQGDYFDASVSGRPSMAPLLENSSENRHIGSGALRELTGKSQGASQINDSGHQSGEWSARTAMVFDVLGDQLREKDSISFHSISKGVSRRTAAACFLEVKYITYTLPPFSFK